MNYGTLPSRFLNAIDNLPNPRAQMVRRDGRWEAIPSQNFSVASLACLPPL